MKELSILSSTSMIAQYEECKRRKTNFCIFATPCKNGIFRYSSRKEANATKMWLLDNVTQNFNLLIQSLKLILLLKINKRHHNMNRMIGDFHLLSLMQSIDRNKFLEVGVMQVLRLYLLKCTWSSFCNFLTSFKE